MADFKLKGSELFDKSNKKLAILKGNDVYDASNRKLVVIKGNDIYDPNNRKICVVKGSDIFDSSNRKVAKLDDIRKSIDGATGSVTVAAFWAAVLR